MILRSILPTWIYFQVVTIIKWDISVYIQGHQVLSQFTSEETNFNDRFEITTEPTEESNETSVCAACEGTTESESVMYTRMTCEVSEDDLQKLFDLILEAYNKINYGFRSSRCRKCNRKYATREDSCDGLVDNCRNSNLSTPQPTTNIAKEHREDCKNQLQEMQNKTHVIIEQLDLLLEAIIDPARLLEKIAQLQNCVKCLEGTIDVVKQDAQKISQCYESSLGRVTTCFTTTINERTKRIQELETRVTNKTINVIVSNVLASKYVEAAIEYRDLRNESLFDTMMNDMFESRQLERILHFGRALYHNNVTGRAIVYMKLMELMKKSQPVEINDIIFSSFVTRDRIEFCSGDKFCFREGLPFEFEDLASYSKPQVDKVLDKWAISVRNNNYKSLLLLGSPEVVNFSGKAFHDVVEKLISKSYDYSANYLSNTLNFVSELRWNNQSYTAFKCLLTNASRLDDKLKIAFRMKERMDNLVGPDENVVVIRKLFEDLARNLPDGVRGLAFNETCVLSVDEAYAISASIYFYEGNNRPLETRHKPTDGFYNYKWKFEKVDRSLNKYEFRIKNVKFEEYLSSHIPWMYASHSHDVCATSIPEYFEPSRKFYNWKVYFDDGASEGNKIYLYHVGRRAYLGGRDPLLDMSGRRGGQQILISCE